MKPWRCCWKNSDRPRPELGSCFPKDVQALVRTAQQAGYAPELLQAVEAVNQFQKQRLHRLISQHFGGGAGGGQGLAGRCYVPGFFLAQFSLLLCLRIAMALLKPILISIRF